VSQVSRRHSNSHRASVARGPAAAPGDRPRRRRAATPRTVAWAGGVAVTLAVIGCGSKTVAPARDGRPAKSSAQRPRAVTARTGAASGPFAWLVPAGAPRGWRAARIGGGATMFYPAGWRSVPGDRGTVTARLLDNRGRYLAYLNLTPRQGRETLTNFATFRPSHNRDEGQTDVHTEASGRRLRFRSGYGTCVRDSYTSNGGVRFVEIACLVRGAHGTSVIVAAAPPAAWALEQPVLERELDSFAA
jgi:hypothetical protein